MPVCESCGNKIDKSEHVEAKLSGKIRQLCKRCYSSLEGYARKINV